MKIASKDDGQQEWEDRAVSLALTVEGLEGVNDRLQQENERLRRALFEAADRLEARGHNFGAKQARSALADAAPQEATEDNLCQSCGTYPADPPSKFCPGCQAYREHQS